MFGPYGYAGVQTVNDSQPQNPSVMILVKNESYFLPYVLKQCEGIFDSYVIYDIDSTDNTREIIEWFHERNKDKADFTVRYMPDLPKEVQGAFRNSMIVEGQRPIYWILDGDELYSREDLLHIKKCSEDLKIAHAFDNTKRFGVFKRVELNPELTMQYSRRRSHHRIYHNSAYWTGNHPGEVSGYKQEEASEEWYEILCWHFHNAERSPNEAEVLKRMERKKKKTYHPGELEPVNILKELPILRTRIEQFPVSPALEALWLKRELSGP